MIKKILLGLVGLSVLLAAASVAIFAAAFALFSLLSASLGVAGAAAIVAGAALLVVVIGLLLVTMKFKSPVQKIAESDTGLAGKLFALAREKPLLSASAAAAAAVIAFRNPRLVTALLTGILAGKATPKN